MPSLPDKIDHFNTQSHPFAVLIGTASMIAGVVIPPLRRVFIWFWKRIICPAIVGLWRWFILPILRFLLNPFTAPGRIERKLEEHAARVEGMQRVQDQRHTENQEWLQSLTAELAVNTQLTRDNAKDLAFQTDAKGNWIWTSPALRDLVQMDITQMLGNGWRLMIASDREGLVEEYARCIRDKEPFRERCQLRVGTTGKTGTFEVFANPVRCRRGEVPAFLGGLRKLEVTP